MTTIDPPTIWTVPEPFRTIYTHAREAPAGRSLFVSGQFGVAPDGRMREGFTGQLGQAMDNVEALLAASGLARPDALVEVEVTAVAATPDAPALGTLRPATTADVPAIQALVRAAYAKWVPVIGREPVPMTADYAQAVRLHRFDLLERDGALVALAETIPRADHLWVENLAVAPTHHGLGLGRWMLRQVEERARARGHGAIRLATNQAFAANLDFYRRAGFVVEREEPFRGGIGVYLAKTL